MADAREWLRLYRMKDFAVTVEGAARGGGGEGGGDGGGGDGGAQWPLAFMLLECRWNQMTYFKY